MRLNYLDILEQCFHDKFRGYNKEEVDTFLHLVADDFKEMAEEILKLKKDVEKKDALVEELKKSLEESQKTSGPQAATIPEILKDKAKRMVKLAKEQAEQHKQKAVQELGLLKKEILKLKTDKTSLLQTIKDEARSHFEQMKNKN